MLNITEDVPLYLATRDPAAVAEINPFIGVASYFGVLFWAAAATLCLFSAYLIQAKELSVFFGLAGALSLLLLFDDLFLLHETIFFTYLHLPEKVVFASYGCFLLIWLLRFRETILSTNFVVLGLSLFFFASSLLVDAFQESLQVYLKGARIFLEDGLKLLGIVGWFGYFFQSSQYYLRTSIPHQQRKAEQKPDVLSAEQIHND